MNLIINLYKEKLTKTKTDNMKKIVFSKLWKKAPIAKSEASVSKTKGLEGFARIKSGVIMKEAFKDWKTLSTSSPPKKGWSFLINWIRGAIIEE